MRLDKLSRPGARGRWSEKMAHIKNRLLYGMPDRYGHLVGHIARHRSRTILEVGVWDARHATLMIAAALRHSPPTEVAYFGFDLFEDADERMLLLEASKSAPRTLEAVRETLAPFAALGVKVRLFRGNSQESLRTAVEELPPMDFAYIDGGHSYETVSSDWFWIQRLMHERTVVIFDDYYPHPGSWQCEQAGVNEVVDGIDRDTYSVTLLRPVDDYQKDSGVQRLCFARVVHRQASR